MVLPLIDFEKLRTFYVSAKAGKFSIAAQKLGMDNSAVTRQIQILERDLNCSLFERGGFRGLRLTEKGHILLSLAHELFEKVAEIEPALSQADNVMGGSLRLWVHNGYTLEFINSCLDEFVESYPSICIDMITSSDYKDVVTREADVAIGPNIEKSDDLIDHKLFTYDLKLYAAKSYVEKYGLPKTVQDLRKHRFVSASSPSSKFASKLNWYLDLDPEKMISSFFSASSNVILSKFASKGVGIASMSPQFIRDRQDLVPILPEISGPTLVTSIAYGEHFKNSLKVNTFCDFLKEKSREFFK